MNIKYLCVSLVLVACGRVDQLDPVPPPHEAIVDCPTGVPPDLVPPVPVGVLFGRAGHGVQVYSCEGSQAVGFEWMYVGPRADLHDLRDGRLRETHQTYPSWESTDDGSLLQTSVYKQVDVDQGSIPWALLRQVAATPGPTGYGDLGFVTWVQRLVTAGGVQPPASQCVEGTVGEVVEVPYDALYVFYGDDGEGECK